MIPLLIHLRSMCGTITTFDQASALPRQPKCGHPPLKVPQNVPFLSMFPTKLNDVVVLWFTICIVMLILPTVRCVSIVT